MAAIFATALAVLLPHKLQKSPPEGLCFFAGHWDFPIPLWHWTEGEEVSEDEPDGPWEIHDDVCAGSVRLLIH